MSQEPDRAGPTRRRLLAALGAAGVPVALAGCGGGGEETTAPGTDDGTDEGTATVSPTPPSEIEFTEGGTLNGSLGSNPSSFDPPYSSGVPSSNVQSLFFEGLVTSDASGTLYPWLAESYELVEFQDVGPADYADYMTTIPYTSNEEGTVFPDTDAQIHVRHPDNPTQPQAGDEGQFLTSNDVAEAVEDGTFGMHYQLSLHQGVTFHDGEELTAANVLDSYDRYANSQVSGQLHGDNLLHVERVDDYTVNLYAQEPSAEALRTTTLPLMFTSEQAGLDDGNLDPREDNPPIGTGPYEFAEFSDQEFLRATRYGDYWMNDVGVQNKAWFEGPENFPNGPVVEEVDVSIIADPATRASALNEGEIDIARGLSAQQQTNFDDSGEYTVVATETGGYLFFQYSVQVEPWDDKRVRQAANHLIPRKQIVENIEQGWSRPAWTPLPKLAYGAGTTDPEALRSDLKPKNEYRPERARQLVEEAGVETPISTTIETNSNNDDRVRKAEVIAEAMNNTGLFDVTVETFEFGALIGRVFSDDYPEMNNILLVGLSGTFDPGSFCEATHHSRFIGQCCNAQGISFEKLDEMMDNAKFGTEVLDDRAERASRYDEVWRRIVELSANSYVDIDLTVFVHGSAVNDWATFPFPQSAYSYGLYAPQDSQLAYVSRE